MRVRNQVRGLTVARAWEVDVFKGLPATSILSWVIVTIVRLIHIAHSYCSYSIITKKSSYL